MRLLLPALLLLTLFGCAHGRGYPPAPILSWPRQTISELSCTLIDRYDLTDPNYQCGVQPAKVGDPCKDTTSWYQGPKLPDSALPRIHPDAGAVHLQWEHGMLQSITVDMKRKLTEDEVLDWLSLPALDRAPSNVKKIALQDCTQFSTCVVITGFDHLGAGDVECERAPEQRP
ncbi:MAG: hypothetical protein ACJ790_20770 [Myxococcaceae bacterium]